MEESALMTNKQMVKMFIQQNALLVVDMASYDLKELEEQLIKFIDQNYGPIDYGTL
jgi:hypothetical protein